MLLDYQGNFKSILDELKKGLNELKTKFCKLESDLHISRNANDKPFYKLVVLEKYCRKECLEISDIPTDVGDKDIKKKVLEILDAIDAPVYMDLVEDSHGIPSKGSPKNVILKLSRGKDFRRVLLL